MGLFNGIQIFSADETPAALLAGAKQQVIYWDGSACGFYIWNGTSLAPLSNLTYNMGFADSSVPVVGWTGSSIPLITRSDVETKAQDDGIELVDEMIIPFNGYVILGGYSPASPADVLNLEVQPGAFSTDLTASYRSPLITGVASNRMAYSGYYRYTVGGPNNAFSINMENTPIAATDITYTYDFLLMFG